MESKLIGGYPFVRHTPAAYDAATSLQRTRSFYEFMGSRRSVREFSDEPVSRELIENIILTASSAPSGAHKQPWNFCVVHNASMKKMIREAAEKEEYANYHGRMSEPWMDDLKPFQTDWHKAFLEVAPCLIIVFRKIYEVTTDGQKKNNYYVAESTGIACGFLLAAIHHAGLVALTHTPSPMGFLSQLLQRPENEKPFLLIPVGYPAKECFVPAIKRKQLDEISSWYW